MKRILMVMLLLSAALVPACSREKEKDTAAPPAVAAPARTPGAEATTGTATPPVAATQAPAPTPPVVMRPAPARRNRPQPPTFAQPGAPPAVPTIPPPLAPAETRAPAAPPEPQWREVTLTESTALPLVLTTAVSSETAEVENVVSARLGGPVSANGEVVLPEGTIVMGTVTNVERSGRVKGRARLTLVFDRAQLKDATLRIRTHDVRFEAESTTGEDAAKIGGGAIGGAIIGGILGGGEGAAKGAAIGGAAGTGVVMMTRGKEVNLPAGTAITATLAAPLTVTVPAR